MPLSLFVYLFFLLSLCLFISSAAGRLRSPSRPFWSFLGVITKGYVPRVSTAKKGPCIPTKNLCYVTHWCCRCWCCFWQWSRGGGKDTRGGRWESDGDREGVKWEERERMREEAVCVPSAVDELYCPRAAPTRCLYFVYFHSALRSVLHKGQQHTAAWHHSLEEEKASLCPPNHIKSHWWGDAPASQVCVCLVTVAMFHPYSHLIFCLYFVLCGEEGSLYLVLQAIVFPCRVEGTHSLKAHYLACLYV